MSTIPAKYNFKDHYRGSTFQAVGLKFNFDITGATIICQIKQNTSSKFIHEWRTGINITVNDLVTGDISLDKISIFTPQAGNYVYDLQIIFPNTDSETYMVGTLKVIQDVTTP